VEVEHKDEKWRVVRIIDHSMTLFTTNEGQEYVQDETYVEIRNKMGLVDFIVFHEETTAYDGPSSAINAMMPITKGDIPDAT